MSASCSSDQPIGVRRPHRQHHVARVGGGVPDADLDLGRQVEAHLLQHGARLAHDARAVLEVLVPVRRQADDREGGARAQRAADDVLHRSACSRARRGGGGAAASSGRARRPPRLPLASRRSRNAGSVHALATTRAPLRGTHSSSAVCVMVSMNGLGSMPRASKTASMAATRCSTRRPLARDWCLCRPRSTLRRIVCGSPQSFTPKKSIPVPPDGKGAAVRFC